MGATMLAQNVAFSIGKPLSAVVGTSGTAQIVGYCNRLYFSGLNMR
jgi:hypothetical protein